MARITDEREMRRRARKLAQKEHKQFMDYRHIYTYASMKQLVDDPEGWINARTLINYEVHVEKNKTFEEDRLRKKARRGYLKRNVLRVRNVKQCHVSDFTKAEQTFLDDGKKPPEEIEPYNFYTRKNRGDFDSYGHCGGVVIRTGRNTTAGYLTRLLSMILMHYRR